MDASLFEQRLEQALNKLLSLTASFCTNDLSQQILFWVEPSGWEAHEGLNEVEAERVGLLCEGVGKSLTKNELLQLLWHEGKVPLWINMSVRKATPTFTFCHLLCSRRLRAEAELYHQSDPYLPFHIVVPLPATYGGSSEERFDINWQVQRPKSLIGKLRHLLTGHYRAFL
ncbi:hypothetical protein [Spirosoma endbachense]|uniref:Uncharacterized protein n=1 Tax=Spirosoma endbachense TaxID=2666025 RepID=A0A6P1VVI1_9BACT|nr:hypothetical protein [Spirosoma endbachense]QHV95659.1 hypothetical protein GJR95_11870 [Spirosoma endbachense]